MSCRSSSRRRSLVEECHVGRRAVEGRWSRFRTVLDGTSLTLSAGSTSSPGRPRPAAPLVEHSVEPHLVASAPTTSGSRTVLASGAWALAGGRRRGPLVVRECEGVDVVDGLLVGPGGQPRARAPRARAPRDLYMTSRPVVSGSRRRRGSSRCARRKAYVDLTVRLIEARHGGRTSVTLRRLPHPAPPSGASTTSRGRAARPPGSTWRASSRSAGARPTRARHRRRERASSCGGNFRSSLRSSCPPAR
jgi:hypothetical protein